MNNNSSHSTHTSKSPTSRLTLLIVVISTLFAATANAQLLQNITIGNPKALGLAHAVTADPPGIDSIHYNPAGLAKIKGRQRMIKLFGAHMLIEGEIGPHTIPDQIDANPNDDVPALTADEMRTSYCNVIFSSHPKCADQTFANANWDNRIGTDEGVAGEKSSTSTPLVMLPFLGITDVPFLLAPVGGIAIEDPSSGWTFATAAYTTQVIGFSRESSDRETVLSSVLDDSGQPSFGTDGLPVTVDLGIGKRVNGDPGELQGQDVAVTRITYFSPSIGVQINDEFAIGVSLGFSWQGVGIVTDFRAPLNTLAFLADAETIPVIGELISVHNPYDYVGELTMEMSDALSLSFNIGALWEPTDWLAFGIVFQNESTADLEGDYKMKNTERFQATTTSLAALGPVDNVLAGLSGDEPFNAQAVEKGTVSMQWIVPAHLSMGTSIKVIPRLKINFDVKWTQTSVWEDLVFEFSDPVDFLTLSSMINYIIGENQADSRVLRLPRNYQDVWSWAIGAEYQVNDNLVLRAGYEPRGSSIPNDAVDLMFPLAETDLYAAGIGYQLDSYSRIDASIAYMHSEFKADINESKNANSSEEGQVVYNPYVGSTVSGTVDAIIFALSYEEKF